MKNKKQMWIDVTIFILIVAVIIYLKLQVNTETINPADGLNAIVGLK